MHTVNKYLTEGGRAAEHEGPSVPLPCPSRTYVDVIVIPLSPTNEEPPCTPNRGPPVPPW